MTRQSMIATIGFACLVLTTTAGCSNINWNMTGDSGEKPQPTRTIVEKENPFANLTAAERNRMYKQSFAEGMRLAGEQQHGLALGAFERAVALRPNAIEARFNLAACLETIGDPMRAVTQYRQILEITPNDSDCYYNLGTSYIKMYYSEKSPVWRKLARECWQKSLELNPDQADLKRFLAKTESVNTGA